VCRPRSVGEWDIAIGARTTRRGTHCITHTRRHVRVLVFATREYAFGHVTVDDVAVGGQNSECTEQVCVGDGGSDESGTDGIAFVAILAGGRPAPH
jgi:hypothetical protein